MRRTLKVSALVALIFGMSQVVWAQAKPDFSQTPMGNQSRKLIYTKG